MKKEIGKQMCNREAEDRCTMASENGANADIPLELLDCAVLSNEFVAPEIYLMTVEAPRIAHRVKPGQFVHMRIPGMADHILRRPFSIYDADPTRGTISILYRTVGFGSTHMTTLEAGAHVNLIGPVGHGWSLPKDASRILLVGGGLGAAPLFLLCKEALAAGIDVEVVLGATTKDLHVCRARYAQLLGREPLCSTDDGTYGYPGFATKPVEALLLGAECAGGPALSGTSFDAVAVCGPAPLMRAVAATAQHAQVPCEVSLERNMACGIGACLSCVVDTVDGKRRACVDGPVFDARKVVW